MLLERRGSGGTHDNDAMLFTMTFYWGLMKAIYVDYTLYSYAAEHRSSAVVHNSSLLCFLSPCKADTKRRNMVYATVELATVGVAFQVRFGNRS